LLLPGSQLFEKSVSEGKTERDIWTKYMRGQAGLPVCLPDGVSREDLQKLLKEAHRRFYRSFSYFLQRMLDARSKTDLQEYFGLMHNLEKTGQI
jgi:hypothetical protein